MDYKRIQVKSGDYHSRLGPTAGGEVTVVRGGSQQAEKTSISVTSGGQAPTSKFGAVNQQLRGEQSRGGAVTTVGSGTGSKR
jgi:hypothetical protein